VDSDVARRERAYLQHRWEEQCRYYAEKADLNKVRHQRTQLFVAAGGVVVPVLLEVPTIIPAALSLLIAMATAIENVYKYGDNWRTFRQTLEALKRERALYDARTGPYDTDPRTAFKRFVERSEAIFAEETNRYFQRDDERESSDQRG
jgi:hypothetical protein